MELTLEVARRIECRRSKEDRCASLLNSGMKTLVPTKPRTVSHGAKTSDVPPAPSGWSGVIVMIDRWCGMCGTWRLSAIAKPLEETSTSSDPHGYLPTLISRSRILICTQHTTVNDHIYCLVQRLKDYAYGRHMYVVSATQKLNVIKESTAESQACIKQ